MAPGHEQALHQQSQLRNANKAPEPAVESASSPSASIKICQQYSPAPHDIQCENYLTQSDALFREVDRLKKQGWTLPRANELFHKQRANASQPTRSGEKLFFKLQSRIGHELREAGAFLVEDLGTWRIKALNLGISPGAYTRPIFEQYPGAAISGIALPQHLGGPRMKIAYGVADRRVQVCFADITMFVRDFSGHGANVPSAHPDAANFNYWSPYAGQLFELVVCDGQALRVHHREEGMTANLDSIPLLESQLILGMTRIRSGGTFVMLLPKAHSYRSVVLLKDFCSFAGSVELFKPSSVHRIRSTCYMVAKNVQPSKEEARACIAKWKGQWATATFGGDDQAGELPESPNFAEVDALLTEFGPTLIPMSQEIWNIQVTGLREWIGRMSQCQEEQPGGSRGDNELSTPHDPESTPLSCSSYNESVAAPPVLSRSPRITRSCPQFGLWTEN
ncbi:MAG: hypothetical protein LQ344_005599 [Seirophora lacunosa]|nr:MAG: hypothetical protein LQ344_005599 [Seirophora lacunosa]